MTPDDVMQRNLFPAIPAVAMLAAFAPQLSQAACSPDPAPDDGTVVQCSGTDLDGYRDARTGSVVELQPDALIRHFNHGNDPAVSFGANAYARVEFLGPATIEGGSGISSAGELDVVIAPGGQILTGHVAILGNDRINVWSDGAIISNIDGAGQFGSGIVSTGGDVNFTQGATGVLLADYRQIVGNDVTIVNDGAMQSVYGVGQHDLRFAISASGILELHNRVGAVISGLVHGATGGRFSSVNNYGEINFSHKRALSLGDDSTLFNRSTGIITTAPENNSFPLGGVRMGDRAMFTNLNRFDGSFEVGDDAVIDNQGEIFDRRSPWWDEPASAVRAGARAQVTNSGLIEAYRPVSLGDDASFTNASTGRVLGYQVPADDNHRIAVGVGPHGLVVNHGLISSASGLAAGVGIALWNTGEIAGESPSGSGLRVRYNEFRGDDPYAYNNITNDGVIRGGFYGVWMETPGESSTHLFNSGTIEATHTSNGVAIRGSSGSEFVTNSGKLIGGSGTAVQLGGGDDVFSILGGTIDGIVDLGAGNDQLFISSPPTVIVVAPVMAAQRTFDPFAEPIEAALTADGPVMTGPLFDLGTGLDRVIFDFTFALDDLVSVTSDGGEQLIVYLLADGSEAALRVAGLHTVEVGGRVAWTNPDVSPVPVPASAVLLASAIGLGAAFRRRPASAQPTPLRSDSGGVSYFRA